MKLPNWIMLCALLFGAMGQYSINAVASEPVGADEGERVTTSETPNVENIADANVIVPIDINKADVSELSTLPGVGIKKAEAIVKYRELNGNFTSVDEIVNVSGIGPKMFAKLNGYISL